MNKGIGFKEKGSKIKIKTTSHSMITPSPY
jgi:hypothetical protein